MNIESLINDFYLEVKQEAPSQEQVNKIVSKYGNNADTLISDLYLHFTGEPVEEEVKTKILATYGTEGGTTEQVAEEEVVETDDPLVKKKESTSISPKVDTESNIQTPEVESGSSDVLVEDKETQITETPEGQTTETETQIVDEPTDPPQAPKRQSSIYVSESTGEVSNNPYYSNQEPSTHLMRAEQLEDGNWVAFPSLFQNRDGSWENLSYLPDEEWETVYEEAKKRGEVVEFGQDQEQALAYGEGSWKNQDFMMSEEEISKQQVDGVSGADAPPTSSGVTVGAAQPVTTTKEKTEEENWLLSSLQKSQEEAAYLNKVLNNQAAITQRIISPDGKLVVPNKNYSWYELGSGDITQLYKSFSEDGVYGGEMTLEDLYKNNPIYKVTQRRYGDLYDEIKTQYPEFNAIANDYDEYANGTYGIKDWTYIDKHDAEHIRQLEVGDFSNLYLKDDAMGSSDKAYRTAGLYRLKSNINYEIEKLERLNKDLLYDNTTHTVLDPSQLSENEYKQFVANTNKGIALQTDYNIVNGMWVDSTAEESRIYDPYTGKFIEDITDPNERTRAMTHQEQELERATFIADNATNNELLTLRDQLYYPLMTIAKKIKSNYQSDRPIEYDGETIEGGDVIDRNVMTAASEFLADILPIGMPSYEEIQFSPANIVSGVPTEELIWSFPDLGALSMSSGLPFLSSETDIAKDYNQLVNMLNTVNRALVLNRDARKKPKSEYVDGTFLGTYRVDDGVNQPLLPEFVPTSSTPNFNRTLDRFNQGFIGGFYGSEVAEYVYGRYQYSDQARYLSQAFEVGGFEGEGTTKMKEAAQLDAWDQTGLIGGAITDFILEFRGATKLLNAPSTMAGAYELGVIEAGGKASKWVSDLAKYGNTSKYFDGARQWATRPGVISNPFASAGTVLMISGVEEGIMMGTTGVMLDRQDDFDPVMGFGFGFGYRGVKEIAPILRQSSSWQALEQGLDKFKFSKVGKVLPIQTAIDVGIPAATATGTEIGLRWAVDQYNELVPNQPYNATDQYIRSLSSEDQDHAKGATMFWTYASMGLLSKPGANALMSDLLRWKPRKINFEGFFRDQEAYNAWRKNQGTPEGVKLLKEGHNDVMANGTAEQKAAATEASTSLQFNQHMNQTTQAINLYADKMKNINTSTTLINGVTINPNIITGSTPTAPTVSSSTPLDPQSQPQSQPLGLPESTNQGGKVIEDIITTNPKTISAIAKKMVKNGDATQEDVQKAIDKIQHVLATNSKIEGINNISKKTEGIQLLIEREELESELKAIDEGSKNGIVGGAKAKREKIEQRIKEINQSIEGISEYKESELDYVTDLLKHKTRRDTELTNPDVAKTYPELVDFVNKKSVEGYTTIDALREYKNNLETTTTETTTEVDASGNTVTKEVEVTQDYAIDKLKEEGIENPTPQQIQDKQSQLMEEGREAVDQVSMEATSAQNKITELEAEKNKLKEEGDELIKTVEKLKEEGKYDEADEFFDKNLRPKRDRMKEIDEEINQINKTQQDAIQESSTESVSVQESPGDSEAVVESVPQTEVPPEEVEVQEEVQVEETPKEEVVEVKETVTDTEPRTPPKEKQPPTRKAKIDQDLDAIVASGTKGEALLRNNLKAKGYSDKQINRAIAKKDRVALTELKNLKKDLQLQGQANKKYTVKATNEFKQQLTDIINGMAKDKNIKFTKGQLKNILNAATGKDMQGLKVEEALDKAIVEVEKAVRKAYIGDINKNLRLKTVEGKKGKRKVGKISPQARQLWQEVKETYDLKDFKDMSVGELEAVDDLLNSIIEDGKIDQRAWQRVKDDQRSRYKGEVNESLYRNQKSTELNTLDEIKDYLNEGNNFVVINGSQVSSESGLDKYINDNPFVDLTGSKGYEATTAAEAKEMSTRKTSLGKGIGWSKGFAKSYETIDNKTKKLRRVGGKAVDEKVTDLTESILGAKYDQLVGEHTAAQAIENQVVKASGLTNSSSRKLLNKKAPGGIYKGMTRKGVTNGQVLYWWMMGKVNGPGIYKPSKVDEVKLIQYMDQNPELKKIGENMFKFMKEWAYPRYNSFYESVSGKPLPEVDLVKSFYFPTSREPGAEPTELFEGGDGNYTGINALSQHMLEKTQTGGEVKPRNAMEVLINYVTSMERSMAYQPSAEKFNNLFNTQSKPQMQYLLGRDGEQELNNIMNTYDQAITNKSMSNGFLVDYLGGAAKKVSQASVVTTLAGKTKSMLVGQPLSTALYYGEVLGNHKKYGINPADLIVSTGNLFGAGSKDKTQVPSAKNLEKDVYFLQRFITDPMFKARWKRAGIDPTLSQYKGNDKTTLSKAWDEASKIALLGVRTGDMGALYLGAPVAQALYNKQLKDGYDSEEAYNRAMKQFFSITTKTQQTDESLFTPDYAKTDLGKALFPYLSSPNAYANLFAEEAKKFRDWGDMDMGERWSNIKNFLWKASLSVPFVAMMGPSGEEEEEMKINNEEITYNQYNLEQAKDDSWYGFIADNIQAELSGYGPIGQGVNWAINAARGRPDSWSQPQLITKIIQAVEAAPALKQYFMDDVEYNDLPEEEQRSLKNIMGNIDNAVELFGQMWDGSIDIKDWILEKPKDYGRRGKLNYYNKDAIRNWYFGISEPVDLEGVEVETQGDIDPYGGGGDPYNSNTSPYK